MNTGDIISLISKISEKTNKFIINEMKSFGIKDLAPSHGDILFVLLKNEKLTMKEISEKINKDKSTVTALIDKLIKHGYVEKTRDFKDNRVVFVTLTKKGRELKPLFEAISHNLLSTAYKDINEEESEELLKTLVKLYNNF
ncbi:MarR family winged helix-turn-helix transcriptional regulator [Clostridium felsineum]|uniref:HTH-type transcriptional regulator SarZ n=1 Tax=Clostridium felsineum TaxID=36839 RepID=A0A1S8LZ34_9CLOT|nr:MarR family transcriptional regulator [Clostridium felsineum]MCR3760685.1 MarR family transcriptional regulator [Clostridium felsineum]URZ04596.1 hypothetical protein CLAUR_046850 [Clostridium felsineum]URZ09120.1 hypothetical protein CLROS_045360 [Clostridium felsineum]URZ13807.1 hypothetical protein CROST_045850 [Clostridium felsineum]